MSQKELDVLLIGEQTTRDSKRDDLDNGDLAAIGNDFALDFKQASTPIPVTMGQFGKHARTPGMAECDIKAVTYLSDNGATAPMFEPWLKSCGFKLAKVGDVRTYTPSSLQSDWTYLTAWKYSGTKVTDESVMTAAYSILCDGVIDGVLGEPIKLSLTGKGVPDFAPQCSTYVSGALALPTDTIPVMMRASTMTAMSFSWDILKVSVAFKNSIVNIKEIDDSYAFGYRYADIADRDIEVKLTVYQTTDLPYPTLISGAVGAFDIIVGVTGAKVQIHSPNAGFQITDVAPGTDGGQNTFEITGSIQLDDFAIVTGN